MVRNRHEPRKVGDVNASWSYAEDPGSGRSMRRGGRLPVSRRRGKPARPRAGIELYVVRDRPLPGQCGADSDLDRHPWRPDPVRVCLFSVLRNRDYSGRCDRLRHRFRRRHGDALVARGQSVRQGHRRRLRRIGRSDHPGRTNRIRRRGERGHADRDCDEYAGDRDPDHRRVWSIRDRDQAPTAAPPMSPGRSR